MLDPVVNQGRQRSRFAGTTVTGNGRSTLSAWSP